MLEISYIEKVKWISSIQHDVDPENSQEPFPSNLNDDWTPIRRRTFWNRLLYARKLEIPQAWAVRNAQA